MPDICARMKGTVELMKITGKVPAENQKLFFSRVQGNKNLTYKREHGIGRKRCDHGTRYQPCYSN